jgi:hypothetical protein
MTWRRGRRLRAAPAQAATAVNTPISVASAFWARLHGRLRSYGGGMKLFGMIADGLAAAINMTECAIALYEAVCRAPEGERKDSESYVPARLEPTIVQWTRLYH